MPGSPEVALREALFLAEEALRLRLEHEDHPNANLTRWEDDDPTWPEALTILRESDDHFLLDATYARNMNAERYRKVWRAMLAAGIDPKEVEGR